jgi:hypothetical protein
MSVIRVDAGSTALVAQDGTDRSLADDGCILLTTSGLDEATGAASIVLSTAHDAMSEMVLRNVTVTWAPIPAS